MSIIADDQLLELIKTTNIFQEAEKEFIKTRISKFDHLDKFKLKRFLMINNEQVVRETYRIIRDKILREEKEVEYLAANQQAIGKAKDIVTKLTTKSDKPSEPVSESLLSNIDYLGHEVPQPPQLRGQPFDNIEHFAQLAQLSLLEAKHVTFSLDDNVGVIIQKFLNKLTKLIDDIQDINVKRGYFRLFMRSSLFNCYLNTGITALRHTEIQPRKIALNLIYQTDPIYLNSNQFEYTSLISEHLKNLVEI
jgi:hypothetical protein